MRTLEEVRLVHLLNTHFPATILRQDYRSALKHRTVTVDGSNEWLSHSVVAEFMLSKERQALDKLDLDKRTSK